MSKGGTGDTTSSFEFPDKLRPYIYGTDAVSAGWYDNKGKLVSDSKDWINQFSEDDPFSRASTYTWKDAQEGTDGILPAIADMFSGGPVAPYTGPTHAGPSDSTQAGWDSATNFANNFSQYFNPIMSNLTDAMGGSNAGRYDSYGNVAAGGNPYTPAMTNTGTNQYIDNILNAGSAGNQYLDTLANDFKPGQNPYLDSMYDSAAKRVTNTFNTDVMQGIRDEALAAGQNIGGGESTYVKGIDQGTKNLSNALGDMAASMYGNAYAQDMSRYADTIGQAAGIQESANTRGLNAANAAGNINANDMARSLKGTIAAGNSYSDSVRNMLAEAGINLDADTLDAETQTKLTALAPQLMQMGLLPSTIYGSVGSAQEGYQNLDIADAINNYYAPQNQNLDWLSNFSNLFMSMNPGSTRTTSVDTSPNTAGQMFGSGAMGFGSAAMYGFNPWAGATMAMLPYIFQ